MLKSKFLIYSIIWNFTIILTESAKFDIFSKSIRCYDINKKYLENATCRLKVTRECPTGLTKIKADIIWVDDIFIRYTVFYRYTGGFRPYLLDFTFDVCELVKQAKFINYNPALIRVMTGIKKVFPSAFSGCPYKGHIESDWYDNNATFSQVLPPIIPAGRFKFRYRAFTSKNETIFIHENQWEVKATKEYGAMDFSMLNMG